MTNGRITAVSLLIAAALHPNLAPAQTMRGGSVQMWTNPVVVQPNITSTVAMRRKPPPAARWSCGAAARPPLTTLRRRLGSLVKDTGRAYRQRVFSRPVRDGSGLAPHQRRNSSRLPSLTGRWPPRPV